MNTTIEDVIVENRDFNKNIHFNKYTYCNDLINCSIGTYTCIICTNHGFCYLMIKEHFKTIHNIDKDYETLYIKVA